MRRFIIVLHFWHVYSKGFLIEEINAENMDAAWDRGHILRSSHQSEFKSCDFTVIEIGTGEKIIRKRGILRELFDSVFGRGGQCEDIGGLIEDMGADR